MRELYQRRSPQGLPSPVEWSSARSTTTSHHQSPHSLLFHNNNNNSSFSIMSRFAPTNFLNERIRAREWDAARIRVLSHPWDASYRAKQMNNATPLHLACLYRAPFDLVEMILDANPRALLCQDSEGWTPLHVILLYGNDDKTALMLIRRGGPEAVSIQSRIVGAPLHLACRHGCSTTVIQELLRANPAMATTANEYSTKPARILWHQYARNPENERLLNDLLLLDGEHTTSNRDWPEKTELNMRDLVDRLALLLLAAKGKYHLNANDGSRSNYHSNSVMIHDVVVSTEDTVGDLGHYVALVLKMYPEQVQSTDEMGNLPLHIAASTFRASSSCGSSRRTVSFATTAVASFGQDSGCRIDPVNVLLRSYPESARIPNQQGLMPLHIALSKGRRTWRTGISAMVLAAPEVLLMRDAETELLPFQLAAAIAIDNNDDSDDHQDSAEIIETILQLLLACPHAITCSQ